MACPCGSTALTPARRREGCPPAKVGSELWRNARGSLSLLSSLHTIRKRSPARFRGHHTRTDPPQIPRGGAVYPWGRRVCPGGAAQLHLCAPTRRREENVKAAPAVPGGGGVCERNPTTKKMRHYSTNPHK